MRWADKTVQFIRPVHTVTMLLGDELIEGEILGVASARTIRGHRFLGEKEFYIQHADQYPQLLREKVLWWRTSTSVKQKFLQNLKQSDRTWRRS